MLGLIWAQTRGGVIGLDGGLPWHLPEDLAHFKATTLGATVLMGRRTWQSLPAAVRPLPGRRNIVVSRGPQFHAPGADVVTSPAAALALDEPEVWVIGGAQLYAATLPLADRIVVTEIDTDVAGDTFAPVIGPQWTCRDDGTGWQRSSTGLRYRFLDYTR